MDIHIFKCDGCGKELDARTKSAIPFIRTGGYRVVVNQNYPYPTTDNTLDVCWDCLMTGEIVLSKMKEIAERAQF